MKRQEELGTKPVGKLLWAFSFPSIFAMVVNAVYNVVDRIFIGRFVGEGALAALTVAFPVMMILFALGGLLAGGVSACMAIQFGRKDVKKAGRYFANGISIGIIIVIALVAVLFWQLDNILQLFGADESILSQANIYMKIILGGFIFNMIAFIFNHTIRTEGNAHLPMVAMLASAVVNIVLDALFIIVFGWGVMGAAAATAIGQMSGFFILIPFYLRGKSHLELTISDFIIHAVIVKQIMITGMATFIGTMGNSIALGFLNQRLSIYGGTEAITSMGAINGLFTLFFLPLMGLQQGMQPIIGYNFGADKHDRVNRTLKLGILWAVGFSTLIFLALQIFPQFFMGMFINPSSPTMGVAVRGLRIYVIMLPLLGLNILGITFFQATDQGKKALILSMLRQFICLVPLLTVLPYQFGLTGVWAAVPAADGLAIVITTIALLRNYRKIEELHRMQMGISKT